MPKWVSNLFNMGGGLPDREQNDKGKAACERILLEAARNGDTKNAVAQLDAGADVNASDDNGWTPLHHAAYFGHAELFTILIERGADVDARDTVGGTALHHAAKRRRTEFVHMLIEQGAAVNAKDEKGETPLHKAAWGGGTDTALALIARGADLNAKNAEYGWTPLHWAARNRQVDTVRALIDQGADVNVRGMDGMTALSLAVYARYESVVPILQEGVSRQHSKRLHGVAALAKKQRQRRPQSLGG